MKNLQSHKRIIVKSVVYRILVFAITFTVVYLATKDVKKTLGISLFTELLQFCFYFGYEICWNKIKWGFNEFQDNDKKCKEKLD